MSLWTKVIAKPGLWIACGAIAGGVATASLVWQTNHNPARAQAVLEARPANFTTTSERMALLRELDAAFTDVVAAVEPSVVHIKANGVRSGGMMPAAGQGSGVIYRADGWIITNDHVVSGADSVTVILPDGREFKGTVRNSGDNQHDIAVVKIEADNLPVASFGNSDAVRAGQNAIAIGAPFGIENTATFGHISGLNRQNAIMNRGYTNLIQTDAPINPGNSGGPLVNINGEVVGINTSIFTQTGGSIGIGFAIPSNQARFIADLLIRDGKIQRSFMGIVPEDLKPIEQRNLRLESGAILRNVQPDGPAAKAGLKEGDVVTRIGQFPVADQNDLRNALLQIKPGQSVGVQYVREGRQLSANVKVEAVPADQRSGTRSLPLSPNQREDMLREFRERFGDPLEIPEVQPRETPENDEPPVRQGQARLGVGIAPITAEVRSQYNIPSGVNGVVVTSVEPDSVAARLDLREGDVILEFGGKPIRQPADLTNAMRDVKWGDSRRIKVARYGENSQTIREQDVRFR